MEIIPEVSQSANIAETSFASNDPLSINKNINLFTVVSTSLADPKIQPAGPTHPNPLKITYKI